MRPKTCLTRILFVATLIATAPASAIDYIIEVVLFENLIASETVNAPALYVPRNSGDLRLNSDSASEANFTMVETDLVLTDNADAIQQSRNYRLISHFAWRQPGLNDQNAQAIRINEGGGFKVFIPESYKSFPDFIPATSTPTQAGAEREITTTLVNGSLKVRLGRFLHLDTRLVFTDTQNGTSYRMNHSRKMRSRELHYIDNPKFGLLVKILPVEE